MKIQFSPDLDFQHEAIASIVDIFEGQETCQTNFTVAPAKPQMELREQLEENDLGIGNRLRLLEEDILSSVNKIQLRNGLAHSKTLNGFEFTIEMETGTGKTYVYLRTIFELNRKYGFTKFIVVVPSIAIKEGVYKSLEITEEHFRGLYDNVRYNYFVYDSQKLGQVRNFATSDAIEIMVINIAAFRRSFADPEKEDKANIIHRPHDRMTGARPIEFIQATNPIVIIDEPQSVDTTAKSKDAIASLNPMCTLRYSATHVDKYNMMYRLDSVDAYQRKLVKQIEVAGIEVKDSHNKAYIKLLKVDNKKSPITARVEIDVANKSGQTKRQKKTVRSGDDLFELSKGRDVYVGYIVEDIYCEEGKEYISFTSKPKFVRLNDAIGGINDDEYKRLQIRKTIAEHLDKELSLRPKGIKVLSLFFIDRVANYRSYDEAGNAQPGKYAQMFEEEYALAIRPPKYDTLFEHVDRETAAQGVHDGYFAVDKRNRLKDSRGEGTAAADESAYQLIMKDKEKLLTFDSKLKFIFSHSALKEGWDNPNVFQICTLNKTNSVMKKRQEIGRGLRIALNQAGERVHGFDVNTLTVMANESYEDFAAQLQKEIEDEVGIRFGVVESHLFANLPVPTGDGQVRYFGLEASKNVWEHLRAKDYIDPKGRVQDSLKSDIKANKVDLPEEFALFAEEITGALRKVAGDLNIKNRDERRQAKLNKAVFLSKEFKDLWNRIKYRTTFRVDFDPDALIKKCAEEISQSPPIQPAQFATRTAVLDVGAGGVTTSKVVETISTYDVRDYGLPDIVTYLQNATNLTRRSLVAILTKSGRLEDFKRNPQKHIEQVLAIIQHQMQHFIVDGIKYQRIGDAQYFAQELFAKNELYGYLYKNMIESSKSPYDHVVYDSDVEEAFAQSLEQNESIKVYAKLPRKFQIDTPLGSYNPDWAVLVENEGQQRLYFVVETKGSLLPEALRPTEKAKIACGKEHFAALGTQVDFKVANSFSTFAGSFVK